MSADHQQTSLQRLPSMTALLRSPEAQGWQRAHPAALVTAALRQALARARERILSGEAPETPSAGPLLADAEGRLREWTTPRVRRAINATGILLHTGLGRAVFPASVVDAIEPALKGYCTLATDPVTGERVERDQLIEPLLGELTGAEAATVVNNNAAATLLVLAALTAGREVIVSRGQLIEIGGSFRLPDVMAQSGARLVEVGTTNRTHLRDYRQAITADTAALLRVHPSNYRVVGFTGDVPLADLVRLAREQATPPLVVDDLGAGALLPLEDFGLPHEPTARESIETGADLVLFSGDKLIGASQAGIILGRRPLIERLRRHPLQRALRLDKTCLMVLERTLALFRDPARLRREHPLYRMIATPLATLRQRAATLIAALDPLRPRVRAEAGEATAYLGSGSLPTEGLPSVEVVLTVEGFRAEALARALRTDAAQVFGRIADDRVRLDMRTVTDDELPELAAALARATA